MKPLRQLALFLGISWATATACLAQGQNNLEALTAANFSQKTANQVVFVSFIKNNCDITDYIYLRFVDLKKDNPKVKFFQLDRDAENELASEKGLWEADVMKISCLKNGQLVEEYDGSFSQNLLEAWMFGCLNRHSGQKTPIPSYRQKPDQESARGEALPLLSTFDFSKNSPDFPITPNQGARLSNGILEVGGEYTGENTVATKTQKIDPKSFSIALNFKLKDIEESGYNYMPILIAGNSGRWFGVSLAQNRHLAISFLNGDWLFPLDETQIQPNVWNSLVVSVDGEARRVRLMLNGKRLDDVIPHARIDFAALAEDSQYDTEFHFMNWGNGRLFEGFADNLHIFSRALTSSELAAAAKLVPNPR